MELLSINRLSKLGMSLPKNKILLSALLGYLKFNTINRLFANYLNGYRGISFVERLLDTLNISFEIPTEELKNLPKKGPYIVISNHPFGFLDGLIMMDVCGRHNKDFKVLANFFLNEFEPLQDHFISLNPFESKTQMNIDGMRKGFKHLKEGKPLGIFPAGEVSSWQKGCRMVEDKEWDAAVIKFIRLANVPIVPIYFFGGNSFWFHLLGKIHPYLRTLSIPSEFFRKKNQSVRLRIGKPIKAKELAEFETNDKAGRYLRTYLYALGKFAKNKHFFKVNFKLVKKPKRIIEPVAVEEIERELLRLRNQDGLLFRKSNYEVFFSGSHQIPWVLREIGRLREITFREVGEGTNKKIDVDKFDLYYWHLFVYDVDNHQIIGAYRMGFGADILNQFSKKGFYITTLFDLDDQFIPILSQTIELGRSFVIKAYQQKPLPLFLLWQGILTVLKKNPTYKYLLGPVSISNDFSEYSKELIIAFVRKNYYNHDLAKWVYPHMAFKPQKSKIDIDIILESKSNDLLKLDQFISGIEPKYLKIPVLLKQYFKQNAKIIGFNIDPDFNYSLDGLIILNMEDAPENTYDFLNKA